MGRQRSPPGGPDPSHRVRNAKAPSSNVIVDGHGRQRARTKLRGFRHAGHDDVRRATNELIRKISGIKTANVDDQITCGWTEPCTFYARDKIHFTTEGYNLLYKTVRPTLLTQ